MGDRERTGQATSRPRGSRGQPLHYQDVGKGSSPERFEVLVQPGEWIRVWGRKLVQTELQPPSEATISGRLYLAAIAGDQTAWWVLADWFMDSDHPHRVYCAGLCRELGQRAISPPSAEDLALTEDARFIEEPADRVPADRDAACIRRHLTSRRQIWEPFDRTLQVGDPARYSAGSEVHLRQGRLTRITRKSVWIEPHVSRVDLFQFTSWNWRA